MSSPSPPGMHGATAATRASLLFVVLPLVLYGLLWVALTWPQATHAATHLLGDRGDGMQNAWNAWWIGRARELGQSPWHTRYLHWPHGVPLYGHTLSPINCGVVTLLTPLVGLAPAYNAVVIAGFVLSGLTAFWLAFYVTRSYAGSLIAGYVYAFGAYHWLHAIGHMNLSAMQYLPLFVLAWYALLERPGDARRGALAGLALWAVVLGDLYYFLYSAFFAVTLTAVAALRRRDALFLFRPADGLRGFAAFVAVAGATVGPYLGRILLGARRDPLLGGHPPDYYCADLFEFAVPGPFWRWFDPLTSRIYWKPLSGETGSGYVGWAALGLAAAAVVLWRRARRGGGDGPASAAARLAEWRAGPAGRGVPFFLAGAVTFWLLSLGPVVHVWGQRIRFPLPYYFLMKAVPPLMMSGVVLRMTAPVLLCVGVLAAAAWGWIWRAGGGGRSARLLALGALPLLLLETLPRPERLPATPTTAPAWVAAVRDAPSPGALADVRAEHTFTGLYYATIHRRPLTLGYVSRETRRTQALDLPLRAALERRDFGGLHRFGVRYVVLPLAEADRPLPPGARLLLRDEADGSAVIDLGPLPPGAPTDLRSP